MYEHLYYDTHKDQRLQLLFIQLVPLSGPQLWCIQIHHGLAIIYSTSQLHYGFSWFIGFVRSSE